MAKVLRPRVAILAVLCSTAIAFPALANSAMGGGYSADAWYVLREDVERRIARLYRKLHALCPPAHLMAAGERGLLPA